MLLELSALPQIPGADCVVEPSGPQFGSIMGDIDTACSICVALELSDKGLVVEVPDGDVSIGAAGEADLGVRADGQCVTGGSRRSEFCLYSGCLGGQVPDGQRAGLATHYQGAAVRQQLAGADVIVSVQAVELGHGALAARLADIPDFDTTFATSVDVTCGVADGDGAHYFPMAQCVDLTSVPRDARAYQCVWGKGHGLHLTICTYMKRISWLSSGNGGQACWQAWSSHVRMRVEPSNW